LLRLKIPKKLEIQKIEVVEILKKLEIKRKCVKLLQSSLRLVILSGLRQEVYHLGLVRLLMNEMLDMAKLLLTLAR
jgi:type III secretory pathway component EscU